MSNLDRKFSRTLRKNLYVASNIWRLDYKNYDKTGGWVNLQRINRSFDRWFRAIESSLWVQSLLWLLTSSKFRFILNGTEPLWLTISSLKLGSIAAIRFGPFYYGLRYFVIFLFFFNLVHARMGIYGVFWGFVLFVQDISGARYCLRDLLFALKLRVYL